MTPILFDIDDNGIGLITFNRPKVRNALNWEAMERFAEVVTEAEQADDLRVVVMTGADRRAFISGGDLVDLHQRLTKEDGLRQHDLMTDTLDRLAGLPVPVIAALEGASRGGGCEVALAADMRIAADDATLAFMQINLGVSPGWGGAQRLYTLLGYRQAMRLLLTGRIVTAPEARLIGLVDQTSNPGEALDDARNLAERLCAAPPMAVRGTKEVLRAYHINGIEAGREREREVFGQLWCSDAHIDASNDFIEGKK